MCTCQMIIQEHCAHTMGELKSLSHVNFLMSILFSFHCFNDISETKECVDLEFSFWLECSVARRKRREDISPEESIPCSVDGIIHNYTDIETV